MKKKYPRLPNGWGSIRDLGKGRTNRFAVHPPSREMDEKGNYIRPKALCYVSDWYVGFAVLNAYRAGTYKPGDEIQFTQKKTVDASMYDALVKRILADYSSQKTFAVINNTPALKDVYNEFYERKFGDNAPRKLSKQTDALFRSAFTHFKALEDVPVSMISVNDLQRIFDECKLKKPSINGMKSCIKQILDYAVSRNVIQKNPADAVIVPEREEAEHGVPFSEDEIRQLWKNQDDPINEMLLIMCYSGFRLAAYKTLTVNLDQKYFQGGIKTQASKDRIVPIHSAIFPLVKKRLDRDGTLLKNKDVFIRELKERGTGHTSHDCRHTFSALCEKYGVNENDRKRMMGHSFRDDITNAVYGHRSVEELRKEIEKIKCDYL